MPVVRGSILAMINIPIYTKKSHNQIATHFCWRNRFRFTRRVHEWIHSDELNWCGFILATISAPFSRYLFPSIERPHPPTHTRIAQLQHGKYRWDGSMLKLREIQLHQSMCTAAQCLVNGCKKNARMPCSPFVDEMSRKFWAICLKLSFIRN